MKNAPHLLLDALADGALYVDAGNRVAYLNEAAQSLLRRDARRIEGQPIEIVSPGLGKLHFEAIRKERSVVGEVVQDGGSVIEVVATPYEGGSLHSLRDRSLARDLDAETLRLTHLETVQRVASGIAHEVKNPLMGISGSAQLLARRLADQPDVREYLEVIARETKRASTIIDQLRDLASPAPTAQVADVDINQILHETVLLQRAAHPTVAFELELDTSLPPVRGNSSRLTQAFLNLVKNAAEFARTGGRHVWIQTGVETGQAIKDASGRRHPLTRIDIADDGPGIPVELREKVFTPYYTTRAEGTGLGLAIASQIVSEHTGRISVQTSAAGGALFRVILPIHGGRS